MSAVVAPLNPTCLYCLRSTSSCHFQWRKQSTRWQPLQNQRHILAPLHTLFTQISYTSKRFTVANISQEVVRFAL